MGTEDRSQSDAFVARVAPTLVWNYNHTQKLYILNKI